MSLLESVFSSITAENKPRFFASLSHYLTVSMRAYYCDDLTKFTCDSPAGTLNEIQHQLTAQLSSELMSQNFMCDKDLAKTISFLAFNGKCIGDVINSIYYVVSSDDWPDKRSLVELEEAMNAIRFRVSS